MDYVRLGLFEILERISSVTYKLDLPARMRIYPVQHIAMLEPAHGDATPPTYETDTYRGQEEDEWEVQRIMNHDQVDEQLWYEVKWAGYTETTWEPKENLKNAMEKVEEYYKKVGQATQKRKGRKTEQLKATDEPPARTETLPPDYSTLSLHQIPTQQDLAPPDGILLSESSHEPS